MKYDFDEVVDRRNTYSVKWDCKGYIHNMDLIANPDDNTIPMFTADMDFRCPESVKQEIQKVVDFNLYGYTGLSPEMGGPYYDAVINWYARRHNLNIKAEEITYVDGTIPAIKYAILAFSKPGDGILITQPVYTPFSNTIRETGRKVVNSQLINTNGYHTVNFDDFEKKAALPDTTCCIICNPHNPTGRVWTEQELLRMYEICTRNHVLVIEDAVHSELIRCNQVFTPLMKITDGQNLVECTAVNKTFNLAALKASNIFIRNEELRNLYRRETRLILPSPIAVAAVIGAYNGGEEWLDQLKKYLDDTIDWTIDFIHKNLPKVVCVRPEGTYTMWLDFRKYGLSPEEQHKKIYLDANVLLSGDGSKFGPEEGQGFERICLATRRSIVKEAMTRIARQFEGL